MELKISVEDIRNIMHAVSKCTTIEGHRKEEILKPINEQLENHCNWLVRKQMLWNEYDKS
jgi:hypothetical protein